MNLPVNVALVTESPSISPRELTRVAAALQKQVVRDFGPIWSVHATVSALLSLDDLPIDAWPVVVMDDIGVAGAAGVHEDRRGQPFALVQHSPSWSLTASHEILEMLGDPFGNRLVAGQSPNAAEDRRVEYLVELCDPCEAVTIAYHVNGVLVSDFITPRYEDPVAVAGVRYSFTGAITAPHQVLNGGYLSWHDPTDDHWYQEVYFGDAPEYRDLGVMTGRTGSIRSWIDRQTRVPALSEGLPADDRDVAESAGLAAAVAAAAGGRAASLRAQIRELTAAGYRAENP
ncbi:MAG TPA: hypothetical protein VOB72_26750 [Candidatus Dormibacteraeota bacterium]|nr:hypothetical protein [Candidatus Dormibacteraeota bacterium]